ncbi:MAG TPA: SDR family oxidoreductase [Cyclobacteriaceae bacterium]|nr:SDR family oxidoreductase [Cyclobacteriaceae bacterium]
MLFDLKDKVAVVTGGASGIGKAIAEVFASQGAQVCVVDLNEAAAKETAQSISDQRVLAKGYACNVSDQKEVQSVFKSIRTKFKKIDILVNSAGIAHIGKLENTSEEDFDKIFQVNVKGVYNCMQAAIGLMTKQKSGVILNVASIASSVGIPDRFAYSMSKGAVVTMTLSTARDYVKEGIRCNCISPARVHTPFVDGFLKKNYPGKESEMFEKLSQTQPIGRMAKPIEVAHLALYLCSEEASFITGCDYPMDGGFIRLNN